MCPLRGLGELLVTLIGVHREEPLDEDAVSLKRKLRLECNYKGWAEGRLPGAGRDCVSAGKPSGLYGPGSQRPPFVLVPSHQTA